MKIHLLSGFLGSGETTVIQSAMHLKSTNKKSSHFLV